MTGPDDSLIRRAEKQAYRSVAPRTTPVWLLVWVSAITLFVLEHHGVDVARVEGLMVWIEANGHLMVVVASNIAVAIATLRRGGRRSGDS